MSEATGFFTDGEAYERIMGRWSRRVGDQFLDWLAPARGLRWVDVGCGNGAFTEAVVARCAPAEIVGIDPSEAQLTFARTRTAAKGAEFRVGDAQGLPFADRSFDVAAMALVISWVPDPMKAVAEMARVVRPGGCVATYMWDAATGGGPTQPMNLALRAVGVPPSAAASAGVSRIETFRSLWERAGLSDVETRTISIELRFADFGDYWHSHAQPSGPAGKALNSLSPEMQDRVKAHLRESLPRDAAGRIAYGALANAVKGRVPG